MQFYIYCLLFAVIGIPLIGYAVRQGIRLGKYMYREYPFIAKFFDEYVEHFGVGLIITVVAAIAYGLARWMGFV